VRWPLGVQGCMRSVGAPKGSSKTKRSGLVAAAIHDAPGCPQELVPLARIYRTFSAPPQPPQHPEDRRVAHRNPAHSPQELAPLGQGSRWTLLEVCLQQPSCVLVQFGLGAMTLLWSQRPPLARCAHDVAFDGGDAHTERSSGLALGRSPLDGFYHLPSEILGVGFHVPMMPCRPIPLQGALTVVC
jgi:hypothetical protein